MRLWLLATVVLALGGCASQPQAVSQRQQPVPRYAPATAGALALDPPVLAGSPRLDLSRDDRGPAAFAGFEDSSTTFYYLEVDDWYSDYNGGRDGLRDDFGRHASSESYGVIHR
jgi:hypothetical protein